MRSAAAAVSSQILRKHGFIETRGGFNNQKMVDLMGFNMIYCVFYWDFIWFRLMGFHHGIPDISKLTLEV